MIKSQQKETGSSNIKTVVQGAAAAVAVLVTFGGTLVFLNDLSSRVSANETRDEAILRDLQEVKEDTQYIRERIDTISDNRGDGHEQPR